jgi:hypothetical protein
MMWNVGCRKLRVLDLLHSHNGVHAHRQLCRRAPNPDAAPSAGLQLLYDGDSIGAVQLLQGLSALTLIHLHKPWASEQEVLQFAMYRLAGGRHWGGRPGNYELMVKQGAWALCVLVAVGAGHDWYGCHNEWRCGYALQGSVLTYSWLASLCMCTADAWRQPLTDCPCGLCPYNGMLHMNVYSQLHCRAALTACS